MKRKSFSLFFIWIAIVALFILQLIRVEPQIVWSSETYIGIFVALIGIAVTMIIGYQIINAIDIKSDLRSMRKDIDNQRNELLNTICTVNEKQHELSEHINNINASVNEGIKILDALRIGSDGNIISKDFDAFCKLHEALLDGLDYDSPNYLFILQSMEEYGRKIYTQSFGGGFSINKDGLYFCSSNSPYFNRKLSDVLEEEILPNIREVETKIKAHKKFSAISLIYIELMKKFYNRVYIASTQFFPKSMEEAQNF